ncbi:nuclear transport factor 2 family protein [Nonomuraea rosea]|uniref:Nuclear transport factor 2 family protein n=1 Tax=Nonomuraea rosea TaxID=638574 RepID=A0ABP6V760_9ACTN
MSDQPSAREVAERFLQVTVGGDLPALADLYAEHSVIEIPFAPPGIPTRFEGREGHRSRFAMAGSRTRMDKVDNVRLHETADPSTVIVEYDLLGSLVPSGEPFERSYIMVMRIEDGLIAHSRDYSNPQPLTAYRGEV